MLTSSGLAKAQADVSHTVGFRAAPVVNVWSETGTAASFKSGQIADAPIVTGRLTPVSGVRTPTTDYESFKVATNTAYEIRVDVQLGSQAADTPFTLQLKGHGANAEVQPALWHEPIETTLGALAVDPLLVTGLPKTARQSGPVESQTVHYRAEWRGGTAAQVRIEVVPIGGV